MCVCTLHTTHIQTSQNFLYMLPVSWFSSDNGTMRYYF